MLHALLPSLALVLVNYYSHMNVTVVSYIDTHFKIQSMQQAILHCAGPSFSLDGPTIDYVIDLYCVHT